MPTGPLLIVGLGNPGSKYADTRHNLGFNVLDELARRWAITAFSQKFHSHFVEKHLEIGRAFLMKPQTFMNLSGDAVYEAVTFFKLPLQSVLVVSDDLDLPLGQIRVRLNGGAGGHNGLKSIIEVMGGQDFPRVRIGIGRSAHAPSDVHVLGKITKAEQEVLSTAVVTAADAVEAIMKEGMARAMNTFNKKKGDTSES